MVLPRGVTSGARRYLRNPVRVPHNGFDEWPEVVGLFLSSALLLIGLLLVRHDEAAQAAFDVEAPRIGA